MGTWLDEPGWDVEIIISSYKIGQIEKNADKAYITVKYIVIESDDSIEFKKRNGEELIKYELNKINEQWKIVGPDMIPPHVKKEAAITNLREIQLIEINRKEQLERLIQEISQAK